MRAPCGPPCEPDAAHGQHLLQVRARARARVRVLDRPGGSCAPGELSWGDIPPLYLPYISAISPLYLSWGARLGRWVQLRARPDPRTGGQAARGGVAVEVGGDLVRVRDLGLGLGLGLGL